MTELIIGLAGNPNVGKTTVFNKLTGMRQHVGNWPGKTVERAEGHFKHGSYEYDVVDLPGNYALSAHSMEEIVSRDFIVDDDSDVIINVVDAANLERNLYLTVQMMELGANLVMALNMNDFAKKKLNVNDKVIYKNLNIDAFTPIVPYFITSNYFSTYAYTLCKNAAIIAIDRLSLVLNLVFSNRFAGKSQKQILDEIQKIERIS